MSGSSSPKHLHILTCKSQPFEPPTSIESSKPVSPMTFAFTSNNFSFPETRMSDISKCSVEDRSPTDSLGSLSAGSYEKYSKIEYQNVGNDSDSEELENDDFEPKSHLGWAQFGDIVKTPMNSRQNTRNLGNKKIYVIAKTETNDYNNPQARPISEPKHQGTEKCDGKSPDDSFVEVVDIDYNVEQEIEDSTFDDRSDVLAPQLCPQIPQSSRFAKRRIKKDLNVKKTNDYENDYYYRKRPRACGSPPPRLEPQAGSDVKKSKLSNKSVDGLNNTSNKEENVNEISSSENSFDEGKQKGSSNNSNEMLKTTIPTSIIPIYPLSKSIMERRKEAVELVNKSNIRQVPATQLASKTISVAPKDVQIPAYCGKSSVTFYSNTTKTLQPNQSKDSPKTWCRCHDNAYFDIDMSDFKFIDDTSAIAVRAHLCDQTRIMIARTALWNREYAQRLGDRVLGTMWQKPDEITAQQTGFCSATVRRCIEIGNVSTVPKCSDRVGATRNDLKNLRATFENDEKIFGLTMRNPHILNQFYQLKSGTPSKKDDWVSVAETRITRTSTNENNSCKTQNVSTPITPEKRVVPVKSIPRSLSFQQPPITSKKNTLRWNNIQGVPKEGFKQAGQLPVDAFIVKSFGVKSSVLVRKKATAVNNSERREERINGRSWNEEPNKSTPKRGPGRPKKEKPKIVKPVRVLKREKKNPLAIHTNETIASFLNRMIDVVVEATPY